LSAAAELIVTELDDAMVVKASITRSTAQIVVGSAVTAGCIATTASFFMAWPQCILLAFIASSAYFLYVRRTEDYELKVTHLEIVSKGSVSDNLGSSRTVCAADIERLEYQEDTTGPETAHHPEGLYAVTKWRSTCLLPGLNAEQTWSVIDRIEARFPDLRAQRSDHSPFGQHFTSLGRIEPK